MFLAGYATFVLGSALCALAPSLAALVSFRVLQGLGAAMLSVTGPALITATIGGSRRGWAFGIFTTVTALGITPGCSARGHHQWPVQLAPGVRDQRADRSRGRGGGVAGHSRGSDSRTGPGNWRRGGFDLPGALLSTAGLLALLLAFNQGEELGGWTSAPVLALMVTALVLLSLFSWWELRVSDPLIDLRELRDPKLGRALIASFAGYMLLAGCNFVLPFYLVYAVGLRPEQVGLVMISYSAVYVAAGPITGRWSDQLGARRVSAVGMLAAAGASALLVVFVGWSGLVLVIAYLVWRAAAYAMFIAPNNTLVMDGSPSGGHSQTSGMLKVLVNLSLVLGLVLFETLFSLPIAEGMGSLSTYPTGQVTAATMQTGMRIAYAFRHRRMPAGCDSHPHCASSARGRLTGNAVEIWSRHRAPSCLPGRMRPWPLGPRRALHRAVEFGASRWDIFAGRCHAASGRSVDRLPPRP